MYIIHLERNHSNDDGYYAGTHFTNGEEYVDTQTDKFHKRVKVYKTQQGLLRGIKYLTYNWTTKDKIRIDVI